MKARRLVARCVVAACALLVPPAAHMQSASPTGDVARALAARIAAAVAPLDRVQLGATSPESRDRDATVLREIASQLRANGLTLVSEAEGAARVRVTCSENIRDRVCVAEIVKDDGREIVAASTPRAATAQPPASFAVLDVRPVLARRDPILDIAEVGHQLMVLGTSSIEVYERGETGWRTAGSVGFAAPPAWPRDPRARLSARPAGADAFLPGMTCRVTVDPLAVQCAQAPGAAWPVGPQDSRLAAGRNYFTSPNAPPFFTAAAVTGDAGQGWLLAGVDGRPHLLGMTGVDPRLAWPDLGGELASLQTACASATQIIATESSGEGRADSIRAYEIAGGRVVALTPAAWMPGPVTALWERPDRTAVLVVAHNRDLDRFESFYVGLACAR